MRTRQRYLVFPVLTAALLLAGCEGDDGTDGTDGEATGPIISGLSIFGAPLMPGGQAQILVSAYSPEGEPLSYEWEIPEGWEGEDTGEDVLVLTAPDKKGRHAEVTVHVSDGEQTTSGSTQVVTRGPVIESFQVSPLPPEGEITFTLEAFNHDGTAMRTRYDLAGLRFEDADSPWQWEMPSVGIGGRLWLQATVEDSTGLTAEARVETSVEGVSPWPGFGGDLQNTGLNTGPDARGAEGEKKWSFDTGERIRSTPSLGPDGTVYVGNEGGELYALDPEDGSVQWTFGSDREFESTPAVGVDGTVYITSRDDHVYALDPEDGSKKWSFETSHWLTSSPAIGIDGTVYIGARGDGGVYALDPEDGSKRWFADAGGAIFWTAPAIGPNGIVYMGSRAIFMEREGSVYAFDPEDGSELWFFETEGGGVRSPAVGPDGTVYAGSDDNHIYALDPDDGSEIWAFESGDAFGHAPAVGADGTVYAGSGDDHVYALDPADGSVLWSFEAGGPVYTAPAIGSDGTIYVGSFDNHLYALDPADGSVQWSFEADHWLYEGVALGADGTIYFADISGKVYAIQ